MSTRAVWARSIDTVPSAAAVSPTAVSVDATLTPKNSERPARPSARVWVYRFLAAVVIPAVLFLGLEAALRNAGFGQSVRFLIPDEKPGYFRTNPNFVSSFLPSSFDLRPLNLRISEKNAANSVRIVVLGESAAQGVPVPSFGFAAQLRAQLRARYPGKEIEVINTGIVAINSHVVYKIARELAAFSPDLFVIYMGNNEVVGPYGPGCAYLSQMPPLWFIRLSVAVKSSRTGQLITSLLGRLARHSRPPEEWGGMTMFVNNGVGGDDPRLEGVYRNFEANLRDILRVASGAHAGTLLCTVGCNLKDCAPLLSLHRPGLTESELSLWERAYNRGHIEWLLGDAEKARGDLLDALSIDPQYADCVFMLGSLELGAGHVDLARQRFIEAEHWDALRFRPDPRINRIVRKVALDAGSRVRLIDVAKELGSDPSSTAEPAGREYFFEHVHFNGAGNYVVARMLAEYSETLLFGPNKGCVPWLDSAACSAALGYTDHERLHILQKVEGIVRNPPFTNQLTYCDDEAALARELAQAKADRSDPEKLRRARQAIRASVANDPENADLATIEEEIDDDLGDHEGALADLRRAQALQPKDFALAADEAMKLSRLGRFVQAEEFLNSTARTCQPRDLALMAPAFADFFVRTKRFDEGRRYLDSEVSQRPADRSLRLIRGDLLHMSGDDVAAEREYRAVLADDPADPSALEKHLYLLGRAGQSEAAEQECLLAERHQPGNQANDLRAAKIYDLRHDDEQSVGCLLAAERSGPVNSGVEFSLARKLLRLDRPDEALAHFAEARRLSLLEGDPAVTDAIGRAIGQIRSRLH